eukprot:TRINITY_DN10359_c0_g1_i1.p1 TRINITY_DN10359_c0_g1~~TRINITY_DN10359_c0_g1_i1.p1  ORF type:complete len:416 (-),score=49.26 TRINITY_DN10359_c0_g1_i1:217-1464(-)
MLLTQTTQDAWRDVMPSTESGSAMCITPPSLLTLCVYGLGHTQQQQRQRKSESDSSSYDDDWSTSDDVAAQSSRNTNTEKHEALLNALPLEVKDQLLAYFTSENLLSTANVKYAIHPYLERLDLTGYWRLTDELLDSIVSITKPKELILKDCMLITDNGISSVLQALGIPDRRLVHVDFTGLCNISDKSLTALAYHCQALRAVVFARCAQITDAGMTTLVQKCGRTIDTIDVADCLLLTQLAIDAICQNCDNLRYLNVDRCANISEDALWRLVKRQTSLEYISCEWCWALSDTMIAYLGRHSHKLRTLNLNSCKNISEISPLRNITSLRSLSLSFCNAIETWQHSDLVAACAGIEDLNFIGIRDVSNENLQFIADNLKTLYSLKMSDCGSVSDEFIRLLLRNIRSCKLSFREAPN